MNTKLLLQTKARNTPWILEGFWRLRNRDKMQSSARTRRVVERGDPVCIEGYPRSANTFACDAFVLAQGKSLANVPTEGYPIPMGNHFHSPAQFHLAKKYGVPALLVLREPMDAALSWVVFSDGDMGPEATLRSYVEFHKSLPDIADAFVIAPFEEVTTDFGKSITRLNQRFGTDFTPFEHSDDTQQEIFEVMEERLRIREEARGVKLGHRRNSPHKEKDERRRAFEASFADPALAGLKQQARECYDKLMARL